MVLREKIFKYFQYNFNFSLLSPLGIGRDPFNLNKLDSPPAKDALCQVRLKLLQTFLRRRIFNFITVYFLFRNYLPLEIGGALHQNRLESPFPWHALCQVWLKLTQCFRRRRFLNIMKFIHITISPLSQLEEGRGPSSEQTLPFTQGCFVPNLVKINTVILQKKITM